MRIRFVHHVYISGLILLLINVTKCYRTGAGPQSCSSMVPFHSNTQPQLGPVPYVITVSKTTYTPREQIVVTVRGCGETKFKGYLMQSRLAMFAKQDVKIGVFGIYNNAPYQYTCPDLRLGTVGQALTHRENSDKSKISFVWQAPPVSQGHVIFIITIVQNKNTYWTSVTSPIVYDQQNSVPVSQQILNSLYHVVDPSCTRPPINNTSTTTSTTVSTTPLTFSTTTTPTTTSTTSTTTPTSTSKSTTTTTTTTTAPPTTVTTTSTSAPTTVPVTNVTDITTNNSTDNTTEEIVTTTEAYVLPDDRLPLDKDCNKTKGCFHDCDEHSCSFIVSWVDRANFIDMELKTKLMSAGNKWIAVGFSYDRHMGSDSVIECMSMDYNISVFQSYNLDTHANTRLSNPKLGISNEQGSFVDGTFSCSFTRQKIVPEESRIFDLRNDWYLMFATGSSMSDALTNYAGMKLPHQYDPAPPTSLTKINLQEYLQYMPTTQPASTLPPTTIQSTTTTTTEQPWTWKPQPKPTTTATVATTTQKTSPAVVTTPLTTTTVTTTTQNIDRFQKLSLEKDLACGLTKGCYYDCKNDLCEFIISWRDKGDDIQFDIKSRASSPDPDNMWIAIAFSHDQNMGNDNVIECVTNDGFMDVYQSVNLDSKTNQRLIEPKKGLSGIYGSIQDGIVHCKFTRKKQVVGEDVLLNLDEDFHIMFAHGPARNGKLLPHSIQKIPIVSLKLVDFQKNSSVSGRVIYYLIKFHGALMIFAWIGCASIAIVIVRYYKRIWPGSTICDERIWYQVHRLMMIVVFLCVIISAILVFLDVEGYSKINGQMFHQAHPIIGIVVLVFTVANPIVALIRPLPGSVKRKCFNWIHWGFGTIGHILAVINIFAGLELAKAGAPPYLRWVLVAYVGYYITVNMILEISDCALTRKERKQDDTYMYEMHRKPMYYSHSNAHLQLEPSYSRLKKVVMGTHVLIITVTTLLLIIMLIIGG
ncbi:ferric-chelate reductase 1-like isoform X1 [Mytilus trossulus]|uniref:ferric-chelate reductase 1-like isoform X1 n=2 Tax=Mytilus trossulus TaxID=6551 RepID=UPI0030070B5A